VRCVREPPELPTAARAGAEPARLAPAEPWDEHAARFAATGLWPLIIEEELDAEPPAGLPPPASGDALTVLATGWAEATGGEEDPRRLDPFSPDTFPGLADPAPGARTPAVAAALTSVDADLGLLLVPVTRPADVVHALRWDGACNYDLDGTMLTSVLRSWEERFDAITVAIGPASLVLAVRRPPTGALALRVAAEHFAVCPDAVDQGALTIAALAEHIDGAPVWSFWWD
jgi:Domain of unknown function (DUF4253)